MSAERTRRFTDRGALAEITAFQLFHQPGCTVADLAVFARGVGLEHVVLSSDAGHPDSPPAPQVLRALIEALAGEGLAPDTLYACAGSVPARLFAH